MKVRAVHKINLGLIEELGTLRRLCVAVDLERRDARLRLDLEGQIVKQMLKQLQEAKAKVRTAEKETWERNMSLTLIFMVRKILNNFLVTSAISSARCAH